MIEPNDTTSRQPEQPAAGQQPEAGQPSRKKTVLISALLLLVAAAIATIIILSEPTARRVSATKETAMLVEVVRVSRTTARPVIVATGIVQAEQDVILRPQVSGEVVARAPEFSPGGFVAKGETLLRIESADYRNALRERQSALRQALAELEIEMGRQQAARSGYELLDKPLSPQRKALVLREPQLEAAKVRVEAARAAVAQARLDLKRTAIEAPFSAHIISRDVNVGSQVAAGDALGRLVGIDAYWVVVSVPLPKLRWLTFPSAGEDAPAPSRARVRNRSAWGEDEYREGRLDRLVGALDEQTRLARVLVTIPDPLARQDEQEPDRPRLMVGEFVEVQIIGKPIPDVVPLDRDYVRPEDTAWVLQDGRLRIRELDIVMRDAERAYVAGGLEAGERVVTTNLATVTEGVRLRVPAPAGATEARETEAPAGSGAGGDAK